MSKKEDWDETKGKKFYEDIFTFSSKIESILNCGDEKMVDESEENLNLLFKYIGASINFLINKFECVSTEKMLLEKNSIILQDIKNFNFENKEDLLKVSLSILKNNKDKIKAIK